MRYFKLPPEYTEKVDIFAKAQSTRADTRQIAKQVVALIVPKGFSGFDLALENIPGSADYDYNAVLDYALNNLPQNAIVKRASGQQLTVTKIDRVGDVQVLRLKHNR